MIEKMKKLSLLIYHASKDRFLSNLQRLGVVHLEANKSIQNEDIIDLNNKISRIKKAEILLKDLNKENKQNKAQVKFKGNFNELLERIELENEKLHNLYGELENIGKEITLLSPWGNFDPDNIGRLVKIGINFKFYSINEKKYSKLEKKDLNIEIINKIKGTIYFILICDIDDNIEIESATEYKVPIKSLKILFKESEKLKEKIKKQKQVVIDYSKYYDQINSELLKNMDELEYNITDASLLEEAEGKILLIHGWVPLKLLEKVENFLNSEDVVYLLEEPVPEDKVPVLLQNDPFSKLFEPITRMHSLPQYVEVDPTPFFAPFFAAFFGLCLADLGYGLILLISIIAAFFFIKNKKLMPILMLGLVLSITTMAGGIVLDSFFGQSNVSKLVELQIIPGYIKHLILFSDMQQQMALAVMVGIIQVVLGFGIQIVNRIRLNGFLAGLMPLGTILLITSGIMALIIKMAPGLVIGPFKIGLLISYIPNKLLVATALAIIGIILVLFFNDINKNIFLRPLIGLWDLYGIITGVPGDILSYVRLFALGLAGSLLGGAFNQIAFMVKGDSPSIFSYFFMVLVLIVGHSINLGLAALSAFVHPLRLVLLEFYKSVGFTGGGLIYSPFKNRIIFKNK